MLLHHSDRNPNKGPGLKTPEKVATGADSRVTRDPVKLFDKAILVEYEIPFAQTSSRFCWYPQGPFQVVSLMPVLGEMPGLVTL